VDLSYLNDVANPQEVVQKITGGDEDVVDARRYNTMRVIMDALSDIKEVQGRLELTEPERALFLAHRDASGVIRDRHEAKGQEHYTDWRQTAFDFTKHPGDRYEVLKEFAPPLAQALGGRIRQQTAEYEAYQGKLGRRKLIQSCLIISLFFIGLSFLLLAIGKLLDREREKSVDVDTQEDQVTIRYRPGRFGPLAPIVFYPLFFNVTLFLITLAVPLALVIAFAPDSMIRWLDTYLPIPTSWTLDGTIAFLIILGSTLVTAPWIGLAFANFPRWGRRSFTATAEGFTVGNKRFSKEGISEIFCRGIASGDAFSDPEESFHFQGTAASRAAESGRLFRASIARSWNLIRRSLGKVQYQVCVHYEGKRRILAKGLNPHRAEKVWAGAQFAAEKLHGAHDGKARPPEGEE